MATEILEFLFFKLTVKLQVAERLNFRYCPVWVCVRSLTLGSQNEQISVIYFMTTPPPPTLGASDFSCAFSGFGSPLVASGLVKAQSD